MDQIEFGYDAKTSSVAMKLDGYYVWDCSVIKAKGKYHMFSSRWPSRMGFGWNWLFNSEICHFVSDKPEGPFIFKNVVFPRRGRRYFDGMNTHNTCIKEHKGKYYLYYMGTTYPGDIPNHADEINPQNAYETWNRKRIGVAVADDIDGEFVRMDAPLLEPRDCSYWDCTCTTNPSVIIMDDGTTYMIYKSRRQFTDKLNLGIAIAPTPTGPFARLVDSPILSDLDGAKSMEDPFIWYDKEKRKFCLIAKDDDISNNGCTKEWGSGFYAKSDDCIHFVLADNPKIYSRTITMGDGSKKTQCNLERPSVLFDENGRPQCIYCASGDGKSPYGFEGETYIICTSLEPARNR